MTRRRQRTPRGADGRGHERVKAGEVRSFEASSVRRAIVLAVAAKVAGVVLIFDPASAAAFEGPKSTFSLAASAVLLGLLGALLLRFNARELLRSRKHFPVAAFALANLLAVLFAEDQYVAIFGAQRRVGLAFVLDMLVLYLAVAIAYRTRADWAILGAAIAGAGALAIGYGTVQALGLDPIPWVDDVRARPPSTFGNPGKFGHFLGATFAAALAFAVFPAQGLERRVRILAWLYAGASLGIAAIVATRGTILGLAVALPALAMLYLTQAHGRPLSRTLLVASVAVVASIAVVGALAMTTPLGERIRGGLTDSGTQQRVLLADAAIRAFADRPVFGHGPDNFGVIYPRYRAATASPFLGQDSAHSWPLQAMATTGLLGLVAQLAIALVSLIMLWRAAAAGRELAAPLFAGAVTYWVHGLVAFGSVSTDWIGWLAAGAAVALAGRGEAAKQRRISPLIQAAVVCGGIVLAITGHTAFQAGREAYTARVARPPDRAVEAALRAVGLDSGRAEYWFTLGRTQRDSGALKDAALSFRAAAQRAPYVSAYWSDLALTQTRLVLRGDQSLGGKAAALEAARRAVEADPSSPTPHHVLAVVANGVGDHAAALGAAAMAIRLYKDDPEYDSTAADAASRSSDAPAARLALELIIREKDSAVLRVALAQLSLRLNEIDTARTHLRRAIELDPANAPARDLARQLGL